MFMHYLTWLQVFIAVRNTNFAFKLLKSVFNGNRQISNLYSQKLIEPRRKLDDLSITIEKTRFHQDEFFRLSKKTYFWVFFENSHFQFLLEVSSGS